MKRQKNQHTVAPLFRNRRAFKPQTVALFAVLTFASTIVMLADVYSPGPNTTDLQGQWINATTSPPGGPPVYGTPGPADDVDLAGYDITASGGSVRSIYDLGSLTVTGMASAVEASLFTLRGSGTLNVDHVDPNNGLRVVGGHLKASGAADFVDVSAGGSVTANTCKGASFQDGSSLTLTGTGGSGSGGSASFFSGSTLKATDFGLINFTLTLNSGCAAVVTSYWIQDTGGAFVNGPNASLLVTQDFTIDSGNLSLSSGGQAAVLNMFAPGGQISVDGDGSVFTAFQDISITGGDLQIGNGGIAEAKGVLNMTLGHIGVHFKGGLGVNRITLGGDPKHAAAIVDVDGGFVDAENFSSGSQITINQDGVLNVQGNGQGASGTVTATVLHVTGGTLNISTLGYVGFNSPGTLEVTRGGSVVVSGGRLAPTNMLVDYDLISGNATSTIDVNGGGTIQADSLVNYGQVSVSGDGSLLTIREVTLAGNPGVSGVTLRTSDMAKIRIASALTIGVAGGVTTIAGGSIEIGTVSTPAQDGEIRVGSGGTLRDNGAVTCKQAFIEPQGVLYGTGTINGKTFSSGRLFPGNSPGILSVQGDYTQNSSDRAASNAAGLLTVQGDYTQNSDGLLSIEIGGADAGTGYDQLQVSGAASIAGTLQVRLVNGFTPTVGQTYRIVNAGSVSGGFSSIVQPSQAGISVANDATGITVTITSVVSGAPVISGPTTVAATQGQAFSYQITATNNPTNFGAMNLPDGLTVNQTSGLISGTPTKTGTSVVPMAANNDAGSGQADLIIDVSAPVVTTPSQLLNISTRMRVLTGDNVLIGGFIVTGTDPKKVIIRGIGPSLAVNGVPIPGRLADPTLELHLPDGTVITNDDWKINAQTGQSQEADIRATTIPPTDDLESAIIATLPPGNYSAVLAGKNQTSGIGVVEAYDLSQAANSQLANISSRGFVDTGDNVMIGGFIVGGGTGGNAHVIVRALGPSIPVAGALADPTLELHDASGTTVATNDNWKINDQTGQSQEADIRATTIPPSNDLESAIVSTLAPGNYTAVVRGKNSSTGVGLVEVYNLQ